MTNLHLGDRGLSRQQHTEPLSAAKREAIEIIDGLPPERLPVVVRLLQRVDEGMPVAEAGELFWQEAKAEGLVAHDFKPPELPDVPAAAE